MLPRDFPHIRIGHVHDYLTQYMDRLREATASIDRDALERAVAMLRDLFNRDATLYVCGNGGSAAISNHMTCDMLKGVRADTALTPRVVSLSTQVELITAIANDMDYAEVFSYQLRSLAKPGDGLLAISSSGNSENIVRTLEWAGRNGLGTIAMTGFSGGRAAKIAMVNLHVPCHNYGIVEDVHQSLMHVMAQYLRLSAMPNNLIDQRVF
jgi:D-sedoheptulose 7-phosphate isomerase